MRECKAKACMVRVNEHSQKSSPLYTVHQKQKSHAGGHGQTQTRGAESRFRAVCGHSQRSCVIQGQCDGPIQRENRPVCPVKSVGLRVRTLDRIGRRRRRAQDGSQGLRLEITASTSGDATYNFIQVWQVTYGTSARGEQRIQAIAIRSREQE